MTVYVVTYHYLPVPRRLAELRPARYAFFGALEDSGALLASGQLLDTGLADGMLVLRADDEVAASAMLARDPYAEHGLIADRTIAAWNLTLGSWAER